MLFADAWQALFVAGVNLRTACRSNYLLDFERRMDLDLALLREAVDGISGHGRRCRQGGVELSQQLRLPSAERT